MGGNGEMVLGSDQGATTGNTQSPPQIIAVRVLDIILDSSHSKFGDLGSYDSIGTIFYGKVLNRKGNDEPNIEYRAKPLFQSIKQYPLKNEIVLLVDAPNKLLDHNRNKDAQSKYYLPNVNIWNHTHTNALPNMQYYNEGGVERSAENYGTVGGNTVRIAEEDNSVEIPLGEYFTEKLQIQPLLPFEGDTIIEGRFGNSIRFGATAKEASEKAAYSTKGNTGDPIIVIRNGALVEEEDNGWEHTIENINDDHSTIYLTSNQILPNMEIVAGNWDSWLANHDILDVGEGANAFDNITRGPKPDVSEVDPEDEENKPTDKEFKNEDIEEDNSEEFPVEDEEIEPLFRYGWRDENRSDLNKEEL